MDNIRTDAVHEILRMRYDNQDSLVTVSHDEHSNFMIRKIKNVNAKKMEKNYPKLTFSIPLQAKRRRPNLSG